MTVEVETPQGLKTGSSVYEVWANNTPRVLPDQHARDWGVKGQAVFVDMPDGRPLFLLMKTKNPLRQDLALMSMAALDPAFKNDVVESVERIAGGDGNHGADITKSDWPMVIRFKELSDSKSVETVDAQAIGVRRITVERTGEAVPTGIERRLSWLPKLKGGYLSGKFADDGSALGLDGGLFSTELSK